MADSQRPSELDILEKDSETAPQDEDEHRNKRIKSSQDEKDEKELTLHNTCSICLEPWSCSGEHRIVSIKCGHLFGNSCIVQWIRTTNKGRRKPKCPECKQPFAKQDIRFVWTKNIIAIDTAEVDEVRKEAMECRRRWHGAEDELAQVRFVYQMLRSEMTKVEEELNRLKTNTFGLAKNQLGPSNSNQSREEVANSEAIFKKGVSVSLGYRDVKPTGPRRMVNRFLGYFTM